MARKIDRLLQFAPTWTVSVLARDNCVDTDEGLMPEIAKRGAHATIQIDDGQGLMPPCNVEYDPRLGWIWL